jgi:NTE family protein
MNATPSSPLHVTSTTASDRPRADQDQPQIDATRRAPAAGERALVLGGGGSTGNAWLIGVIAGLFDAGLDVTEADLIIGTSAGSTAAAQITSATPTELLANILTAAPQQRTGPVGSDGGRVPNGPVGDHMERTSAIIAAAEDPADMRRRMGAAARHRRRPAAQSALAGTSSAHHGG